MTLREKWDEAKDDEQYWSMASPPGACFTEHKFSLVDAIHRAADSVFRRTRDPDQARDLYVSPHAELLLQTLPGFDPWPFSPKGEEAGRLNSSFHVLRDLELALPPYSMLLVGEGGACRIFITGVMG